MLVKGIIIMTKPGIVQDTRTIRASSIRLVLSNAAVSILNISSHDVIQAYPQSSDKLSRDIFCEVKLQDLECIGIKAHNFLKIKKPLYGLCDSGNYWVVTMNAHVVSDLGISPLVSDSAFYTRFNKCKPGGTCGVQVDDRITAGNDFFQNLTKKKYSNILNPNHDFMILSIFWHPNST